MVLRLRSGRWYCRASVRGATSTPLHSEGNDRWRTRMDQTTVDWMLNTSLLLEASVGLDRIADRLVALHDAWRAAGADDQLLAYVRSLIGDLGCWSGRMLAGAE